MIDSVLNDIKSTFRSGNMISRLIIINIGAFIVIALIKAFDPSSASPDGVFQTVRNLFALISDPWTLLKHPWTLFTHMFLHVGFWHILWNMLLLFWFGRIVGDLLGDRRILPLYILGGLFGGLIFILWDQFLPGGSGGLRPALGASAAVMCMLWVAATTAPDYSIHLILIGPVKLKYVALAILFMDILRSAGDVNTGGHFAHIGGAVFGMLYTYALRNGTDLTEAFSIFSRKEKQYTKVKKTSRKKFKVVHSASQSDKAAKPVSSQQEELDRILEKITDKGYENLTDEEKEFLYQASKK